MKLTLVTPKKTFLEGVEVSQICVPGYKGQLDIRPGHAPLLTTLHDGEVIYKVENAESHQPQRISVSSGYCEVSPLGVKVLAERAELL